MEQLQEEHAEKLFELTDQNRDHLRQWLPWLDFTQSVEDTRKFIHTTIKQQQQGRGPQFAIFHRGKMCGVNGFHPIEKLHKSVGLGYWLAKSHLGKGIVTKTSRLLLKIAYEEYFLHKVELHCAEENKNSRAVAERLGFTYEATIRDCEWLYSRFVNHRIYSMLDSEFHAQCANIK